MESRSLSGVTSLCIVPHRRGAAAASTLALLASSRATVRRSWKYAIAPGSVGSQNANSAVDEHGDDRERSVDAERGERADHAAVDAADAARQRQQVAEHPDEVGHHDHADRRRAVPNAWNAAQSTAMLKPHQVTVPSSAGVALTRIRRSAKRTPAGRRAGTVASRAISRARAAVAGWQAAQPALEVAGHAAPIAQEDHERDRAEDRRDDGDRERRRRRGRRPAYSPKPATTSAAM